MFSDDLRLGPMHTPSVVIGDIMNCSILKSRCADVTSHIAEGGDGAGEAVACDWLVGGV